MTDLRTISTNQSPGKDAFAPALQPSTGPSLAIRQRTAAPPASLSGGAPKQLLATILIAHPRRADARPQKRTQYPRQSTSAKCCVRHASPKHGCAQTGLNGGAAHFSSTFRLNRVASQHVGRHKSAQLKGSSVSHRAAIAAIQSPAKAAADLRVLSLGVLLLSVILIPLSRAVWMPAT